MLEKSTAFTTPFCDRRILEYKLTMKEVLKLSKIAIFFELKKPVIVVFKLSVVHWNLGLHGPSKSKMYSVFLSYWPKKTAVIVFSFFRDTCFWSIVGTRHRWLATNVNDASYLQVSCVQLNLVRWSPLTYSPNLASLGIDIFYIWHSINSFVYLEYLQYLH